MTYTEHKITLDIHKTVSSVSLRVKKGDTGRRLLIYLTEKGMPYHIDDGCYAVFTALKPDGKVVFNDCAIRKCVIRYDLTEQTVAVPGMLECEIILYGSDGKQLTSATFNIIVEDTIYNTETEVESTSEYNALADLISKVQAVHNRWPMAPAIVCQAEGAQISVADAGDYELHGLRIFGKSTQDGTPTPDNPVELVNVGADGSIEAKVVGKNIVSDMVYSGFSKDYASLVVCNDTGAVKKGKTYTISITLTADKDTRAYWNSLSKFFSHEVIEVTAGTHRYSKTFTALADGITGAERILVTKYATGDGVAIKPSECQIELGEVATGYEIAEQSMVISTPDGLAGIPVASGGNYTDADGQQWICDEIDLGRGVYVQRIGQCQVKSVTESAFRETDNGIKWSYGVMATDSSLQSYFGKAANYILNNKFPMVAQLDENLESVGTILTAYGHAEHLEFRFRLMKSEYTDTAAAADAIIGTIIYYPLATAVEIALSKEDIAAFAQLHSYKPNTTIYNDTGAHMVAEYVADTKTYTDSKTGTAAETVIDIILPADSWIGSGSLYSQVVKIDGITEYSQVNLNPSVEQLAAFYEKDITFITENDGGVVTVYVIGQKPENTYMLQANIVEVIV